MQQYNSMGVYSSYMHFSVELWDGVDYEQGLIEV